MVDHVEEENLGRRRFVRKLLVIGGAAGIAGILANKVPSNAPVERVFAASGGDMIIDGNNTGSSGTVLTTPASWTGPSFETNNQSTSASGAAIFGQIASPDGFGVMGINTATSGLSTGVWGQAAGNEANAVYGESTSVANSGSAIGVYGTHHAANGAAVWGDDFADSPNSFGTVGTTPSTMGGTGVAGFAYATSGANAGVFGSTTAPQGAGTQGNAFADGAWALLGRSQSPGAVPLVAQGNTSGGQTANLQEWWLNEISSSPLNVVNSSGSLGIGTSNPASPFHVIGSGFEEVQFLKSGGTQPSRLHATGDGINRFALNMGYDGTNFNLDNTADNGVSFLLNSNASASGIFAVQYIPAGSNPATGRIKSNYLFMTANGNVGLSRVPTTNNLEVEGNASKATAGSWLANSDMRIKTDIQDIDDALATIRKLHPVRFRYTDEYRRKHPSIKDHAYYNFIAQEYREVFPDSVQDDGTGLLQVDTYNATPYLVKAVQEQQKTIEQLHEQYKAEIEQLETENKSIVEENKAMREEIKTIEELQERIEKLEKQIAS